MEEYTDNLYQKFDNIVSNSLKSLHSQIGANDRIILKYKKKDLLSDYILELSFFWATLQKKPVYVRTDLITFLNLKFKRKKQVHFAFKPTYFIDNNKVIKESVGEESMDIIEKIYKVYYEKKG